MTASVLVALVHAAVTACLTGLIWFVQVVHYPLFSRVGIDAFESYEVEHVRRTGFVVGPLMLAELVTALALLIMSWGSRPILPVVGLALLAVIWISTIAIQVPCHRTLEVGYDAAAWSRLVQSNWIRTAAWSARLVVAFAILVMMLRLRP